MNRQSTTQFAAASLEYTEGQTDTYRQEILVVDIVDSYALASQSTSIEDEKTLRHNVERVENHV